mmetsp:Transcript_108581/g.350520  ORF Transcript_108581/g.350520 Transcript_108581/m.350520 type:complete len:298 (+) Transcript_108581:109-1002(+)
MEPMPMPTRSASTPQSMRCFAWRFVTTLPPMTWRSGNSSFIHRMMPCWKVLSPWLLSTTMASTPAITKALTRSLSLCLVPTAAATIKQPFSSLVASGKSACFRRSVRATRATKRPACVTMGSLPFFESWMRLLACAKSTPSSAVMRSAMVVMTEPTRTESRSCTKSVSRFVTRPRSLEPILPFSVTGKPVKPHWRRRSSSSESSIVGEMQIGSMMKPLLYFFTRMTSADCASTERFVWMTPRAPSSAMAMAMRDSVTVSIGLETMGVRSLILRVTWDSRQTSFTPKLMCPGRQMRSS